MIGLGDWELVPSSETGMLAEAKGRLQKDKWVAFNAWKPHYMNVMFDIHYLEDPEGLWPEGSNVYTSIRTGFEEDAPNYFKFLKQFKVTTPVKNVWIDEYGRKEGKRSC